jgi:hypothetical protein
MRAPSRLRAKFLVAEAYGMRAGGLRSKMDVGCRMPRLHWLTLLVERTDCPAIMLTIYQARADCAKSSPDCVPTPSITLLLLKTQSKRINVVQNVELQFSS